MLDTSLEQNTAQTSAYRNSHRYASDTPLIREYVTELLKTVGKIAAHSAYEMFSWNKYLIVGLVFSHLGFWSGNLFLIAPFPDLCLLVPFHPFNHDGVPVRARILSE